MHVLQAWAPGFLFLSPWIILLCLPIPTHISCRPSSFWLAKLSAHPCAPHIWNSLFPLPPSLSNCKLLLTSTQDKALRVFSLPYPSISPPPPMQGLWGIVIGFTSVDSICTFLRSVPSSLNPKRCVLLRIWFEHTAKASKHEMLRE